VRRPDGVDVASCRSRDPDQQHRDGLEGEPTMLGIDRRAEDRPRRPQPSPSSRGSQRAFADPGSIANIRQRTLGVDRYAAANENSVLVVGPHNGLRRAQRAQETLCEPAKGFANTGARELKGKALGWFVALVS
jgi:hypothetical protein